MGRKLRRGGGLLGYKGRLHKWLSNDVDIEQCIMSKHAWKVGRCFLRAKLQH